MKIKYYLLPTIFLGSLVILAFVSKAQAGSGRRQSIPGTAPEPMPKRPSPPLTSDNTGVASPVKPLSWDNPYRLNNLVCRESQGNIICLNSEEAKKLRWSTPTPSGNH